MTENWIDVFTDSELNETLREDGIIKLNLSKFDTKAVDDFLCKTVEGYPHEFESTFYGSVSIPKLTIKEQVHMGLEKLTSPSMQSMFVNHRMLSYFFLVKGIGDNSILRMHQDWSIIDERKYRAYNLWIPLVESTVENGTLFAIKGSHRFPLNIRGAGIPAKYADHFSEAKKHLKPIHVKPGEALVFDSRLLHYSPPNFSESSRTAVINNIIPTEAETMCFHGQPTVNGLEVNRYDVPEDLFIHYDDFNNQKDGPNPKGINKTTIDYANTESIGPAEFKKLLRSHGIRKKRFFF